MWGAHQLLGVRGDEKGGAMFLFEAFTPKGKNREPGPGAFSVRKMTEGRALPPCARNLKNRAFARFFNFSGSKQTALRVNIVKYR